MSPTTNKVKNVRDHQWAEFRSASNRKATTPKARERYKKGSPKRPMKQCLLQTGYESVIRLDNRLNQNMRY